MNIDTLVLRLGGPSALRILVFLNHFEKKLSIKFRWHKRNNNNVAGIFTSFGFIN